VTLALGSRLRRDLPRAMRLTFLVALAVVAAASVTEIVVRGLPLRTVLISVVVLTSAFVSRLVEYRGDRPVSPVVDGFELAGVMTVLALIATIDPLLGTMFFLVLCRSAVGRLARLIPVVLGYMAGWVTVSVLVPTVEVYVGALISLPMVALLVFAVRTLLLRLQAQHAEQHALLDAVLTRLPYPVVVVGRDGAVVRSNPAALALTGSADLADIDVRKLDGEPLDLRRLVTDGEAVEAALHRSGGDVVYVRAETVPLEAGLVIALLDITAQRLYEQHLHHAAYHDALTGLPNRALLWQELGAAERSGHPYAVLLIDLDGFKGVNDSRGHQAGDELLRGVAQRFRHVCGAGATVARLGGDEFAVLLRDPRTGETEAAAAAVRSCFDWPYALSSGPCPAGATVGFAFGAPNESPEQVLAAADRAMYQAKPRSGLRAVGR
jgi:diguanylate cyclase (GGDEF)-like protein